MFSSINRIRCAVFTVLTLNILSFAALIPAHQSITEYRGPQTCIACHADEAADLHSSVHYQWSGPTDYVPNISSNAGKADLAFNTYCGSVITSPRATCATCHIGNGKTPTETPTFEQLENIDCLMCHQDQYQRKLVSPFPKADFNKDWHVDIQDLSLLSQQWLQPDCDLPYGCGPTDLTNDQNINMDDFALFQNQWGNCSGSEPGCDNGFYQTTVTDYQGTERDYTLPIHDDQGNFQFGIDEASMSITAVQAAQSVHTPTRESCLRCHAYAAGTNCGKRGDLSTGMISPPENRDVHMSPQGENMACQDCHEYQNHHVLGRGLDLRPNDRPAMLTCTSGNCHSTRPHGDWNEDTRRDKHARRIACQTCHIPTFAKLGFSTEVERNWSHPHWAQGLFGGQGGYKPEELRDSNIIPTYKWYDGTSYVYVNGQQAMLNDQGQYEFAAPNGWVNSDNAKIHPMKEHISNSAILDATGQMIPHSTFTYFLTGDFTKAVEAGMQAQGLTGSWSLVPVHTFQTINHGVEPEDNALACGQCHASMSGGPVRMDLQGELGYELKGPRSTVCRQCHGPEENKPFRTIHDIHVKDERYGCQNCHNFSRN